MTANGAIQLGLYLVVLLILVKPLGAYMARVYERRPIGLDRVFGWLERFIYRLVGVRPDGEMGWKTYATAMLTFNFVGLLAVYLLQRLQGVLPLNPQGFGAVSADSAFNTAVSFATNTNWQGYGGETTMGYLTQMLALTVQNFVSAAAGMATLVALVRGEDVHLTPIEYRLLTTLIKHAGKVLTHRQLLKEVWGRPYEDQPHYLHVYMAQLRRKIEADPARPRHLLTEPGVGYRLTAE
jgi:hypothetical protein